MSLGKLVDVNGQRIKLDHRLTCASESVIYLALCKLCAYPTNTRNFYFGQTVQSLMKRSNGHREKFKLGKQELSALSAHVYNDKHPEAFGERLNRHSYEFGVVSQVNPRQLNNRKEDYYIYKTAAKKPLTL